VRRSPRLVIGSIAAAVVAAVAVLVIVAVSRSGPEVPPPRVVQPGAPGQPARTLGPDEVEALSAPPHTPADAAFMRRMIPHHAQALEMTALVAGRTDSTDIPRLAQRIELSQRDEIAQMQRWLMARGEALPTPHAGHGGHGGLMPGMLDVTELARLSAARGPAFDKLFLELMIRHHQGAITMVDELYRAGGGVEPTADRFAREVNADQSIEIRRMQDMLASRS
jgi:uncharacterized protein (DUF305 family)